MCESTSSGVHLERRAFLRTPALLGALAVATRAARGGRLPAGEFEAFVARWTALAGDLPAGERAPEEPYLHRLGALLAELPLGTVPAGTMRFEQDGLKSGPAWFGQGLFVVELRLEPGAVIRPHNHPDYTFVTVGLEGECRYRHFEVSAAAPAWNAGSEEAFDLRAVRSGVMTPGRQSSLSRSRDNVHTFTAGPEGARLLDFGTARGDESGFSYLAIDEPARDPARGLFTARWVGPG